MWRLDKRVRAAVRAKERATELSLCDLDLDDRLTCRAVNRLLLKAVKRLTVRNALLLLLRPNRAVESYNAAVQQRV